MGCSSPLGVQAALSCPPPHGAKVPRGGHAAQLRRSPCERHFLLRLEKLFHIEFRTHKQTQCWRRRGRTDRTEAARCLQRRRRPRGWAGAAQLLGALSADLYFLLEFCSFLIIDARML